MRLFGQTGLEKCSRRRGMEMSGWKLWLLMFALNIPVYFIWGWILFRRWADFWEAIVFWLKPELWSLLDGEYWDDVWAEAKLAIWLLLPIGLILLELGLLGI